MLSYQHAYHAGNFADVHKHLTLYAVTDYLLRKKSAITYIDTHAGRGLYPLASQETQKLKEYALGIAPLWKAREQLKDPLLADWMQTLASAQPDEKVLSHYPGSPWWLAQSSREQDRLQLFELHPGEHEHLSAQTLPPQVRHTYGDGLAGLKAMLPVATPRVCGLIDPSYERKGEYQDVVDATCQALNKARHAVLLVWYPLLPAGHHQTLLEGLETSGIRKVWHSELLLEKTPHATHGMYGSGMVVINPPWGLDERLVGALDQLTPCLGNHANYRAGWRVGE